MEIIGREIEFGVGVEETRGTPQGTAEKWAKNVECNLISQADRINDDATRGRLEDSDGSRVTRKWFEGDISGIVHADAIGYLFYNLYGTVSSSNVAGSVYDHDFSLNQSIQHPALSFFVKDGSVQQNTFANGMIGSLELTATTDDYIRFTAGLMASTATTNADTPSYDTEYDFISRDIVVKVASTEGGLAGATAEKLKDVNITFNQNITPDYVFGSYNPDDIYNTSFAIEGTFTKNYLDSTFEDLYTSDNARYMSITITGEADIGGGSNPTITIILNKAQITDWNRSGGNDELVTEEVSFKAFYNATDTEASTVSIRNITSEYDQAISA